MKYNNLRMPKGLVLTPGLNLEVSILNDSDQIHDKIDGHFQMMGSLKIFKPKNKEQFAVVGYVDEEKLLKGLKNNEWTILLKSMGFKIYDEIVGPIILFNSNEEGEDEDISPMIIERAKAYKKEKSKKKKSK